MEAAKGYINYPVINYRAQLEHSPAGQNSCTVVSAKGGAAGVFIHC